MHATVTDFVTEAGKHPARVAAYQLHQAGHQFSHILHHDGALGVLFVIGLAFVVVVGVGSLARRAFSS